MISQHNYELLAACILSDQVAANYVIELMKDRDFAKWYLTSKQISDPSKKQHSENG